MARRPLETRIVPVLASSALIFVAVAACGPMDDTGGSDPIVVADVAVSPSSASLDVGDTVRLAAAAYDLGQSPVTAGTPTWASQDTMVATVDASGLVTAVDSGGTNVTATVDGISGSAAISVDGGTPPPAQTVLLSETFESASAGVRGWIDNTSWTLSTAERHGGSSSLEWHWAMGAVTPTFGGTARHVFTESETVYVSYWAKYSSNWVGSGQPFHPHEFYLLTNEDSEWIGPAETHLTAYIEHNVQSGGLRPALGVQDALNVNVGQVGNDLTSVTENRSVAGCNGNTDGYPTDCYAAGMIYRNSKFWYGTAYLNGSAGPTNKNDWHHIEAYFALNSIVGGIGQSDGVVQYWVDGNLIIDIDDALLRTGQHPNMAFRTILMGPYMSPGAPVDQYAWIDDLIVADRP